MNCPNCAQPVETAAQYCGNCGQLLGPRPASIGMPGYALAVPGQHYGETKALLALIFGSIGLVSMLFMALLGLLCGVAGIVLGTMSRSSSRRRLSTAGLVISGLAVLGSIAVGAHTFKTAPAGRDSKSAGQNAAPTIAAASLSTPCYTVGFVDTFNISNIASSCNLSAFNGRTLDSSANAYKIYASQNAAATDNTFGTVAKQALEKDVKTSLPGFTLDTEQAALFAGSPAYFVHVSDKFHGLAVVEAAVYHRTASGNNVFVLVHVDTAKTADLTTLEAQWQWK